MSENVIDVIKIGIEYILLAIFLLFVSQIIQLRNSYASGLNSRKAQESAIQETLEYSMYDTGTESPSEDNRASKKFLSECVSGDEVVSCIRNYADGSVNIFVDGAVNENNSSYIRDGMLVLNSELATNTESRVIFTQKWLQNHIDLTASYHPYLIYDNGAVPFTRSDSGYIMKNGEWYSTNQYKQKGEAVTGIAFIKYRG